MRSKRHGKSTSIEAEVQSVTGEGMWLWVAGEELYLSFADHPWFLDATIGELRNVVLEHGVHLRWPDLDVDLAVESLRHPERFPLAYR